MKVTHWMPDMIDIGYISKEIATKKKACSKHARILGQSLTLALPKVS